MGRSLCAISALFLLFAADDEADDQKSAEAAEAAKEKGAKATAKSKIDNKMTVYEEHLKEKVEMEVNGLSRVVFDLIH